MAPLEEHDSVGGEREYVAIIGMAGRFPGAKDVDEFWRNLCAGVESIRPFTPEELRAAGVDPALLQNPQYVNAGAPLEDAECFDAAFFGYLPREAELMDPQQRLFLEAAWSAIEHAGYDPLNCKGRVGVFGGVGRNMYLLHNILPNHGTLEGLGGHQALLATDKDFTATRVAYKLNLRGPAMTVQTACSTSGVAIHLACQSLLLGESDMALAGGGRLRLPMRSGYLYEDGGIQSPDGHCRAFDANAKGTVMGNGVAIVTLKRLSDALRDRDTIHAVIKGTAINNDGSDKVGFTAPSVEGQAAAIAEALAVAEVDAESVTYIEAHGTGTSLGDPIEIAALTKAFRQNTNKLQYCAIGSVKTNIGHLDAGAGAAGLIKAALSLKHGLIPPSLNFQTPNPQIDFANSPFVVTTELQEWTISPRRAGVSSFGLGGTNSHIVLEEPPPQKASDPGRPFQLLILSAKTIPALDRGTDALARRLEEGGSALGDVAYTLQVGRHPFAHRRFVVANSASSAAEALRARDTKRVWTAEAPPAPPSVVFMFPGQGSQFVNMGRNLYEHEEVFSRTMDECCDILQPLLGLDLRKIIYPSEIDHSAEDKLRQTFITQPAIFAIGLAYARLWEHWGIKCGGMIGHSIGEYVAAHLAGVFDLRTALGVLTERARLIQEQPPGAMLAVSLPEAKVRRYLSNEISLAALNSPTSSVLAGPPDAINALAQRLADEKIASRRLQTSHAFHSSMMDPVLPAFAECVRAAKLNSPKARYISSVTGEWITGEQVTSPDYWVRHLRETVRFAHGIETLQKAGLNVFLEVGPGAVLTSLARQSGAFSAIPSGHHAQTNQSDLQSVLVALGHLWCSGVQIDWGRLYTHEQRRRIPLPPYSFERTRYWLEPRNAEIKPVSLQLVTAPVATMSAPDRKSRLVQGLKESLAELSGKNLEAIPESATFLSLGFDSLFLTQAAIAVHKKFGVRVALRDFLEAHPTIGAMAEQLDKSLPAEPLSPLQKAEFTVEATPRTSPAPPVLPASSVEGIIQQQLHVMSEQLALLRGNSVAPAPQLPVTPSPTPVSEPRSFGPFKPIDKSAGNTLSPVQQKALSNLIERYNRKTARSKACTEENRRHLADPRAVSGFRLPWKEMVYPIVADESYGSKLRDVDGNEYIDFTMGFGVSFFGHNPKFIQEAIAMQLARGMPIGPQSSLAGEVAKGIARFTKLDRVTFCNTGSEAVLAALRIARTVTGRDRIALFARSYHGINDEVLVRPAHDDPHRALPIAPGILPGAAQNVLLLEYGAPGSLEILQRDRNLAAVLVEPVQSRQPNLQPRDFLKKLRQITTQTETALIFDEVISGFRLAPGGAQEWYGVQADIATYGKVIGGGMPFGAVAGRATFMDAFDGGMWQFGDASVPQAGVTFFAGTFVRHPLALAAAAAVLRKIEADGAWMYEELEARAKALTERINSSFEQEGAPMVLQRCGSLFHLSLKDDAGWGSLFWYFLREQGVHAWENRPCFISTAHTDADLDFIAKGFQRSIEAMQAGGFWSSPPARQVTNATSPSPQRFALTSAQMEIWLAVQGRPESSGYYNESNSLHLAGPLDLPMMQKAVEQLTLRHASLRTRFSPDGQHQEITHDSVSLEVIDLSSLSIAEQKRRATDLQMAESTTLFDLVKEPPARWKLLRFGPQQHILILTVHHIVCDGWSLGTLIRELGEIYSAHCEGRAPNLLPIMPFSDYAQTVPEKKRAAEGYWLKEYAGPVPRPTWPTDKPAPAQPSSKGASLVHAMPRGLQRKLRELATAQNTTLFTTLLAGFQVFLHKLTGDSNLAVGIPAAGQAEFPEHSLVGHCANLLPVRSAPENHGTFASLLASTRHKVLDAFEHQACTFGDLVQKLNLPRESGRVPLLTAIFNVDRTGQPPAFRGLSVQVVRNPKSFTHFDFGLNIRDTGEDLRLECDYNTDLFAPETISRWLAHLQTVYSIIADDPQIKLNRLALLSREEERELVIEWNGTEAKYCDNLCVHDLVESQAAAIPDALAITFGDVTLSYAGLNERANSLAAALRRRGVGEQDIVAISLERSVEMVVAVLAAFKTGAAYVPLDPAYPRERLDYMLKESGAKVLITHQQVSAIWSDATVPVVLMDGRVVASPVTMEKAPSNSENLCYLLFTSGSTGKPKGVEIAHRSVVNVLTDISKRLSLGRGDITLAVTSLSFDISVAEIFLPLITGGRLVIASREETLNGGKLLARLQQCQATYMQPTPVTWRLLIEAGWAGSPQLKMVSTGESLPRDLAAELLARGAALWNLYGPTETTIWSSAARITSVEQPITIGRPIANTQFYILDKNGAVCPIGIPGELFIGGDGLARGYRNRPELTAEKFVPSPLAIRDGERLYRTGDLARYLPNGEVECLGRIDHQVKIRGFRIELGEIEFALSKHPKVQETVVIARSDNGHGPQLIAYVTSHGSGAPTEDELRQLLRKDLPDYMVPGAFVFLAELPRTPNGKIDRNALPAPQQVVSRCAERTHEFADPLQFQLKKIWEATLGIPDISLDDNFFTLGGHSILAVKMFSQIEKLTGKSLPLATLFAAPTIEQLATVLRRDGWEPPWSALVPIQPLGSRPPLFCVHAAGGNVLFYNDLAGRLGTDQPLYGLQAVGMDGKHPRHNTVEEMATHYLREIRSLQPHGPYLLGASSYGGWIILEMARQLTEVGEPVGLVALFDTHGPDYPRYRPGTTRYHRKVYRVMQQLEHHFGSLWMLKGRERWEYFTTKAAKAKNQVHRKGRNRWRQLSFQLRSALGQQLPENLRRTEGSIIQAVRRYQPKPYAGRVTLFRAAHQPYGIFPDPYLGWDKVVQGEIEVHEVPGYHGDIIVEPRVRFLLEPLQECLERGQKVTTVNISPVRELAFTQKLRID